MFSPFGRPVTVFSNKKREKKKTEKGCDSRHVIYFLFFNRIKTKKLSFVKFREAARVLRTDQSVTKRLAGDKSNRKTVRPRRPTLPHRADLADRLATEEGQPLGTYFIN